MSLAFEPLGRPVSAPHGPPLSEAPQVVAGPRVTHWTIENGSGMHRVAESLAEAERALGLDSFLADPSKSETWDAAYDADIHVCHTHIPSALKKNARRKYKVVWVGHGTPEHVVELSVQEAEGGAYGHGDGVQLMLHWLREADARITFWDRHKWIYDRFLTKGARPTDCVPLGVDLAFWSDPVPSRGKFAGDPSVFTAENPHRIKWPLDLYWLWPSIADEFPEARLHSIYMPKDLHRVFFPLIDSNGTAFTSYVTPMVFDREGLRNAFRSTDFTLGLVRYGDLNHLSLQSAAAGAKTISYRGNPYASFWVTEGDQREMTKELLAIFRGDVAPRTIPPIPDVSATARAMADVYSEIL